MSHGGGGWSVFVLMALRCCHVLWTISRSIGRHCYLLMEGMIRSGRIRIICNVRCMGPKIKVNWYRRADCVSVTGHYLNNWQNKLKRIQSALFFLQEDSPIDQAPLPFKSTESTRILVAIWKVMDFVNDFDSPLFEMIILTSLPQVNNGSRKRKAILQALAIMQKNILPMQRKPISKVRKCFLFCLHN